MLLVACVAIVVSQAAQLDEEARAASRKAFRESSNFFARQIEQNTREAMEQATIRTNVGRKSAQFQKYIDAKANQKDRSEEQEADGGDVDGLTVAAASAPIEHNNNNNTDNGDEFGLGRLFARK